MAIRAFLWLERHFYATGVKLGTRRSGIVRGAIRAYIEGTAQIAVEISFKEQGQRTQARSHVARASEGDVRHRYLRHVAPIQGNRGRPPGPSESRLEFSVGSPVRFQPLPGRGDGRQVATPEQLVVARGRLAAQPGVRCLGSIGQPGQVVEEVPWIEKRLAVYPCPIRGEAGPCPDPVEVVVGRLIAPQEDVLASRRSPSALLGYRPLVVGRRRRGRSRLACWNTRRTSTTAPLSRTRQR